MRAGAVDWAYATSCSHPRPTPIASGRLSGGRRRRRPTSSGYVPCSPCPARRCQLQCKLLRGESTFKHASILNIWADCFRGRPARKGGHSAVHASIGTRALTLQTS
eukprot:1237490-Pleurochrysis_carterae.AAC.1